MILKNLLFATMFVLKKPTKHIMLYALGAVMAMAIVGSAGAQNLPPPVSGLQILDLAGGPVDTVYKQYTASFVAATTASTVTFVFRHDPGFFAFDDASVVDSTHPSGNLLTNPGFETGPPTLSGGGSPGWTYFQQAGVTFLGLQAASPTGGLSSHSGNQFWYDGATQGYDGIDQTFATTLGDTYQISFWLNQAGGSGVYQQVSTNGQPGTGGNGIDVVVYAGNGLPPTGVPEPATMLLLGLGLVGLAGVRRFKK